jgi:hypothetical protein
MQVGYATHGIFSNSNEFSQGKQLRDPYFQALDEGVEWADFLRARTELMRTIGDGQDGVIEVKKVVGDLTEMGVGAPLLRAQRHALNN